MEKQSIQERKLDDIFPDLNLKEKNLFLKIDTQGYEFKVIQGAEKILKNLQEFWLRFLYPSYMKDKKIG